MFHVEQNPSFSANEKKKPEISGFFVFLREKFLCLAQFGHNFFIRNIFQRLQ